VSRRLDLAVSHSVGSDLHGSIKEAFMHLPPLKPEKIVVMYASRLFVLTYIAFNRARDACRRRPPRRMGLLDPGRRTLAPKRYLIKSNSFLLAQHILVQPNFGMVYDPSPVCGKMAVCA
jgi:hypothetical protein